MWLRPCVHVHVQVRLRVAVWVQLAAGACEALTCLLAAMHMRQPPMLHGGGGGGGDGRSAHLLRGACLVLQCLMLGGVSRRRRLRHLIAAPLLK